MTAPRATYRLQLRGEMDFDAAARLAPHIARLGASHVYLSPIWTAAPGSTHGYDVANPAEIDPDLGGRAGFARLTDALAAEGLRVALDIVPNHMAADPKNPWWASVLEWGAASRYAGHFDIDWRAERLLLPILGDPYLEALEAGVFRVERRPGGFALGVYDRSLPLTPRSFPIILGAAGEALAPLARAFGVATPDAAEALAPEIDRADPAALDAACAAVTADRALLHRLHEAQPWRLAHWRMAREALTYRRFFEISDLIGVRVERPDVFEDVHALLFALMDEGRVHALRIDHVDGLADPRAYLARLRRRVGPDVPIWVEKIVHYGETLPADWPVEGTTGYEFAADMAGLFADPAAEAPLDAAYAEAGGAPADFEAFCDSAKRRILAHNLAAELDGLTETAVRIARRQVATRDLGRDTLRRSIVEMARALPVYRTYVSARGPSARDRDLIRGIAEAAKATREIENEIGVDFVASLLSLDLPDAEAQVEALGFATRFQQVTGPVTAKALEDTVYYRYNRLIGLNEVGGAPERVGRDPGEIHRRLADRQPHALLATATHDTKRGEDARARLYAITLAPERWAEAAARWRGLVAPLWGEEPREGEVEWTLFQTLLGAWPPDLHPADAAGLAALSERVGAFFEKAGREAKARTSWTHIDDAYEARVRGFVSRALDPAAGGAFLADFAAAIRPFLAAGDALSLSQTALKLCAPGVPDIYQGTEGADLSMVDPDNRRPPDFAALGAASAAGPSEAFPKLGLIRAVLAMRAAEPALFEAPCRALAAAEDRAFALARESAAGALICAAPIRACVAALSGLRPGDVGRVAVRLPERLAAMSGADIVAGAADRDGGTLEMRPEAGPLVMRLRA